MSSHEFFLLPLPLPYPCPRILASPYANSIFLWKLGRGIKPDPVTGATLGGAGGADVRPRVPHVLLLGGHISKSGANRSPAFTGRYTTSGTALSFQRGTPPGRDLSFAFWLPFKIVKAFRS